MSKKRLSPEAKFRVFVLLVLVIIVGLGGLILYNIKTNPSFWETSVSSCITISQSPVRMFFERDTV